MRETNRETQLRVVANEHRRRLLVALQEQNLQRTEEADSENLQTIDEELDGLQIEFRHNHLPRLEDAELITWNRTTNEISKGPNFDEIQPLLEPLENDYDDPPEGVRNRCSCD